MTHMSKILPVVLLAFGCASSACAATDAAAGPAPDRVFHIQLWDGQKTGWREENLKDLRDSGFTVIQNGWRDSLFPSLQTLDKIAAAGLRYGAYIDTRRLFIQESDPQEKLKLRFTINSDGTQEKGEYNTLDPTYQKVVARGMAKCLQRISTSPAFFKIMLNSERNAPISYDAFTEAAAVEAGALDEGKKIPIYARGVAQKMELADMSADRIYDFLHWWDSDGGDNAINRVAAAAAHDARPGVLVTSDPLRDGYTYGQYRGMDVLQDWVRVHQAPRDPLSIAYRTERLKAHVRRNGRGEIWIGPQLGTKNDIRSYAAPADIFEEALYLAVGFGARGVTMWGYDTVRRHESLDMDMWGRIRRFRTDIDGRYRPILSAVDAPRNCAVFLSKANMVLSERPYYEVDDNYEHFYRVLLTAHVPADVIYDDDVLDGALMRYKAVFSPCIERVTRAVDVKIIEYEKSGGRVITWPRLAPRYADYEITKDNVDEKLDVSDPGGAFMLPHQYRQWRVLQAKAVYQKVADLMDVRVDNPDVIMNVISIAGKKYAFLVNDSRTYGAWTAARMYRWCEDEGRAATAVVTTGRGEGEKTITVTLDPAGTALVPLD